MRTGFTERRMAATGSRSRWRRLPVPGEQAQPLEGLLTTTLKDCQEDFEYRVSAGELESRIYQVKIVHPLLLKALQATITPPPYTRQPPAVAKDGNWNAVEGSRVEIEIQLDRTPATAKLELKAGGKPLPEKVDLQDRRREAQRRARFRHQRPRAGAHRRRH